MNATDKTKIEKVNSAVVAFFDIETNRLYNKDRTSKATLARGFVVYILHNKMSMSIGKLSMEYKMTPRAIFWHNAKINDFIHCYNKYKKMYDSICEMIK